jgi:phage terminase small subunit
MSTVKRGRKSAAELTTLRLIGPAKPSPAPADLPPEARATWTRIAAALPAGYLTPADEVLLHEFVLAEHHKRLADALVASEGLIVDGKPHPAAKLSCQLAAVMATLATKLRLCQSSRTRPESASLKTAHRPNVQPPWATDSLLMGAPQ